MNPDFRANLKAEDNYPEMQIHRQPNMSEKEKSALLDDIKGMLDAERGNREPKIKSAIWKAPETIADLMRKEKEQEKLLHEAYEKNVPKNSLVIFPNPDTRKATTIQADFTRSQRP